MPFAVCWAGDHCLVSRDTAVYVGGNHLSASHEVHVATPTETFRVNLHCIVSCVCVCLSVCERARAPFCTYNNTLDESD